MKRSTVEHLTFTR